MTSDNASTVGRIHARRDVAAEFEAALERLKSRRREDTRPDHSGRQYTSALTPEQALTTFAERQRAYSLSIEHGLARLETLMAGDEAPVQRHGIEPWPELDESLIDYAFPRSKRMFDLAVAIAALVFLAPLMLLLVVAIRLDSRGPALFGQRRLGQNGRSIRLLKFRTMRTEATQHDVYLQSASNAGLFKITGDDPVTRVGRFLRRTSLDELPQLLNVVRGDLSLVGPRPFLDFEVVAHESSRDRLRLRPGITGVWQISDFGNASFEDMVRLDYLYAARSSLLFDLKILLKTVVVVWRGRPTY
jgi:lipopolysaccharide/colanic/teichoic acid biosynthesis glycosyltransferase